MVTRVEVWENEESCGGNTSRRRVFRVLPNRFSQINAQKIVYVSTESVMVNDFEPISARVASCLFYKNVFEMQQSKSRPDVGRLPFLKMSSPVQTHARYLMAHHWCNATVVRHVNQIVVR